MARVIMFASGSKRYFDAGNRLHREDGPAIIYTDGEKIWKVNGTTIRTWSVSGKNVLGKDFHIVREQPNGFKETTTYSGVAKWPKL